MQPEAVPIERVFHALADPTRRLLVERLSGGPVSVSQLAEPLPVSLAAVMQHLQVLEECGIVRTQKLGRVRTCQIETAGLSRIEGWIRERKSQWERRFDRLGEVLREDEG
jgi:DNA-binding transcriptional ArsR family regulator